MPWPKGRIFENETDPVVRSIRGGYRHCYR
jgi:hypothetical protein